MQSGVLVNQDESGLGNVIERLEPSLPQFVDGKAVWPEGVSEHVKELFENFSTRAEKGDSTVEELQIWCFTACKQFEVEGKQLKYNISQRRKKLLSDLANATVEEQSDLIQFHKVGMDADFD